MQLIRLKKKKKKTLNRKVSQMVYYTAGNFLRELSSKALKKEET